MAKHQALLSLPCTTSPFYPLGLADVQPSETTMEYLAASLGLLGGLSGYFAQKFD
jgi:hypothetical protein